MRSSKIIYSLLLIGALYSGAATTLAQLRLYNEWRLTPTQHRAEFVLGTFAPIVQKIRTQVPLDEGIFLVSSIDPALLPYALFPRKIWQAQTEPETNHVYMDLPQSPFPQQNPENVPVSWLLVVHPENIGYGGELNRLAIAGRRR